MGASADGLERADEPAGRARRRSRGPGPPARSGILVADDNADGREAMSYFLQSEGHSVVRPVTAPARSVQRSRTSRTSRSWTSACSGLNGYQVAERLREAGGATPVVLIALSGLGQDEDKRRAADAGFDCHFTKPVDIPALMKLLGEVADR